MAHVGRLYPVLFRRDISLNKDSTNDRWARAVALSMASVQGSWGGQLQLEDRILMREMTPGEFDFGKWESNFMLIRGRMVQGRAEIVEGTTDKFKLTIWIDDLVLGNLVKLEFSFYELASYSQMVWPMVAGVFPRPLVIRPIGSNGVLNWRRILWAEYNSLVPGW